MKRIATGLATVGCCAAALLSAAEPVVRSDMHGQRAAVVFAAYPRPAALPAGGDDGFFRRGGGNPCTADWYSLGPYGGDVEDVAMSPVDANIVLAGTAPASGAAGGLYRSTDQGATWTRVAGMTATAVYDIVFSPTGVVYVATLDGVWKSTDAGASWTQLNLNIGLNDQVFRVALDPNNENVVYAGVADAMGAQTQNVLRSTDGGSTWTNITPPMTTVMSCRGIAINPNDSNNIFAAFGGAFGGGQVWVSTDGAASWVNRSAGLPNNPMNDVVHDGARVLVCGGQAFGSQYVGLYSSSNNGQTWTALHDSTWPSRVVNDIELDPANAGHILLAVRGGVYRSTDGGESWEFGIGGSGAMMVNSVRLDSGNAQGIFLGASSVAVWRSTDGGATFSQSSVGIKEMDVYWVAANAQNIDELAIAFQGLNDGGVYTSLDGGMTWSLEANLPPTRYSVVEFAPDGTLYAISDGPSTIAPEGVYRRNADGSWTGLGPDQGSLFESELRTLRFSRNDPNLILTGGNDFGVAGWEGTIFRTDTGGSTWDKVYESAAGSNQEVHDIAIVEDGTDSVMIACYFGWDPHVGGALRSTNGGADWAESSAGLPATAQGQALQAWPDNPLAFYFASGDQSTGTGGLYVTADGGQTWAGTGYAGRVLWEVVCNPTDARMVYINKSGTTTVMASYNSGASFERFGWGLESAGAQRQLHYAFGDRPRLLLATSSGVYANDMRYGPMNDCNANSRPDECDIAEGTAADTNANGIPDTCECSLTGCDADLDGDCRVGLADLAVLLSNYGRPGRIVDGDVAPPHDGRVDLADLAYLLSQYGDNCE